MILIGINESMKTLLCSFLLIAGTVFGQTYPADHDKYTVTVTAGSDLLRKPFDPRFSTTIGAGYRFTEDHKLFDTFYGTFGYTQDAFTTYHVGLQRTMFSDIDRLGLLFQVEGGLARIHGSGDVRASGAVGVGLGYDLSGAPYPNWLNHSKVLLIPKLNKIDGVPLYWTLALGFSKSF